VDTWDWVMSPRDLTKNGLIMGTGDLARLGTAGHGT
jgi:hypothetical protein